MSEHEKVCPDCGTPLCNYCLKCKSSYIAVDKEITPKTDGLCFECMHAKYDSNLTFYDIRCDKDNEIHDENGSCILFEYNPKHSKVNPRLFE